MSLDDRTLRMVAELRLQRQMVRHGCSVSTSGLQRRIASVGGGRALVRSPASMRKWRLHDLRHFSATQSIASGHDVRTVASRLGHADASMTMRVYAHAVAGRDHLVAGTMAAVLDDPAEDRSRMTR